MSEPNEWSAMDVLATLTSRDCDRDQRSSHQGPMTVDPSPGFNPGQGRYVIDPDYMEVLGLDSFEDLIQYHK